MRAAFITTLAMLVFASSAIAAGPYLICDANSGATYYVITGLPAPLDGSNIPAQSNGSVKFDLASTPTGGPYNITVKACNVWGCSTISPFAFSRPVALTQPAGIGLAQ
jgi:hypothetical protein